MATPLSSPFSVPTLRAPLWHGRLHAPLRASSGDDAAAGPETPAPVATAPAADEEFEKRVLQLKSRVGPKKRGSARARKRKAAAESNAVTLPPEFEKRVLQLKSRVGPKKRGSAGARKRKAAAESNAVTLPPVPLREPRSALGLPVEFGFAADSERLNGLLATVGLTALLLVELGSGKSLVKYHQAPTLFLQVYTIVAAGTVYVKYEKERISVWPAPAPPKAPTSGE
uniref:Uncharacterized protein n=1 Tax=Aegilops tauschii TaxID=37682 RepID=M8BKD0_AEGTA